MSSNALPATKADLESLLESFNGKLRDIEFDATLACQHWKLPDFRYFELYGIEKENIDSPKANRIPLGLLKAPTEDPRKFKLKVPSSSIPTNGMYVFLVEVNVSPGTPL